MQWCLTLNPKLITLRTTEVFQSFSIITLYASRIVLFCFDGKTKQEHMEISNDCKNLGLGIMKSIIHILPTSTNNLGILVKYLLTPEPAQG